MRFAYRSPKSGNIYARTEESEKAWSMLATLRKRKITFVYVVPNKEEE